MIIAISGSVGCGKTTITKGLEKRLDCPVVNLSDLAKKHKIRDVPELETFDFDIDALLEDVYKLIRECRREDRTLILEGHFAHFIDFKLVDFLFVINRDLKDLKGVYVQRGYNDRKIKENLEVEALNVCFYGGIERGYKELNGESIDGEKRGCGEIFLISNDSSVESVVRKIMKIIDVKS